MEIIETVNSPGDVGCEHVCKVCGDTATGYRYCWISIDQQLLILLSNGLHNTHQYQYLNLQYSDSMEPLQCAIPAEFSSEEL